MADQQPIAANAFGHEKRRSIRVVLVAPVQMTWPDPSGSPINEPAETESVNRHGGLLRMKNHPPASTEVELKHGYTGQTMPARVVRLRGTGEDGRSRIAIELASPSETFWGIPFQLQEVSAQLRRVDENIQTSEIDARVLRDFSQAADHCRRAAWAAQQWAELQGKGRDPYALLTQVTTERVRRMTQLAGDLSTDLDTTEVTFETEGLQGLFQSVQGLFNRLSRLFKE